MFLQEFPAREGWWAKGHAREEQASSVCLPGAPLCVFLVFPEHHRGVDSSTGSRETSCVGEIFVLMEMSLLKGPCMQGSLATMHTFSEPSNMLT